ncbi:hypothetical protein L291_1147 [Acinetobacter guillouiae MSP4-18]|nr:hypothetical protein L291_1147 [Acinetobacter guillouiae MSP4-18]
MRCIDTRTPLKGFSAVLVEVDCVSAKLKHEIDKVVIAMRSLNFMLEYHV